MEPNLQLGAHNSDWRSLPRRVARRGPIFLLQHVKLNRGRVDDPDSPPLLVPEVPHSCHHHRGAGRFGDGDHLGVAHRAARLGVGADTGLQTDLDRVGNGLKRVGAAGSALHCLGAMEGDGLGHGLAGGVDPTRLTRAQADLHPILDQDDRVRDDATTEAPGEVQIAQLR